MLRALRNIGRTGTSRTAGGTGPRPRADRRLRPLIGSRIDRLEGRKLLSAASLFDDPAAGADGWIVKNDAVDRIPAYYAAGGNPGGFLETVDQVRGLVMWWKAPAKFLGNQSDAYGRLLTFDLKQQGERPGYDPKKIVRLRSGNVELYYDAPNPSASWTSYQVKLDASQGWIKHAEGQSVPASEADVRSVLGSLDALLIRAEFRGGIDSCGLDNVVLGGWTMFGARSKWNGDAARGGQVPALADVTGDGRPDIVSTDFATGAVWVNRGLGNGFGGKQLADASFAAGLDHALVSDVNADGRADLVGFYRPGGDVYVALGRGDGTFGARSKWNGDAARGGQVPVLADVTGDGRPDIVSTDFATGAVWVNRGLGNGFGGKQLADASFAAGLDHALVSDVNADGRADLVGFYRPGGDVYVALGRGDGTFGARSKWNGDAARGGQVPVLADVTGDGRPDIVSTDFATGAVWVNRGLGNGFGGKQLADASFAAGLDYALVSDVNADARADLVGFARPGGDVYVALRAADASRPLTAGQPPLAQSAMGILAEDPSPHVRSGRGRQAIRGLVVRRAMGTSLRSMSPLIRDFLR